MTHRAVKLLVSVRDADEAAAAIAGGADIIDAKEPNNGSLGAVDEETLCSILVTIGGQRPVSAALGELRDRSALKLPLGLSYAKIGLAHTVGIAWEDSLARHYADVPGIAVAYADHERAESPPPQHVLDWAVQHRAAGVLIDTFIKDRQGLFTFLDEVEISRLLEAARHAGLMIALAGSLSGPSFERALALEPTIVAVRGAACVGTDRRARIDECRVRVLADLIATRGAPTAASAG